LQQLQRRLGLISFAAYRPHPPASLRELLAPALIGLQTRTVEDMKSGDSVPVLLIGGPMDPHALARPPDRAKLNPP
jgi:hypothetical protein